MKSILVSGGNSGIGLQAAREFVAQGHRVVILGRDQRKGEQALASLGEAGKQASFFAVDLSTHTGVRGLQSASSRKTTVSMPSCTRPEFSPPKTYGRRMG